MKLHRLKTAAFAILAAVTLLAGPAHSQAVSSFDDIQFWAGTGSTATHRAAMVIQWNLGAADPYTPHSIVWGFGWDSGSPTGWDMITAIAAADPRFSLVSHPSFPAAFGMFYDTLNNGTGFTPGVPDDDLGGPEDGHANSPGNYYQEGWADNGFWGYSIFGGNFTYELYPGPGTGTYNVAGSTSYADVAWFSAPFGATDRQLVDNSWDAWSFAPGFADQTIVAPTAAAVPEPATFALLAIGGIVLLIGRRRARHA